LDGGANHSARHITLGRNDSVHNRRNAASQINSDSAVSKLFDTIGPRFSEACRLEQRACHVDVGIALRASCMRALGAIPRPRLCEQRRAGMTLKMY
jgi:hypothetical protein